MLLYDILLLPGPGRIAKYCNEYQTGTALCGLSCIGWRGRIGRARAAAAYWLAGSAGRLAGADMGASVAALAVRQLDSAAAGCRGRSLLSMVPCLPNLKKSCHVT